MIEPNLKKPLGKQDRKVGQILLDQKIITSEQLAEAITFQYRLKAQGNKVLKIGEVLLFQKIISLQQLHDALRAQTSKADESRTSSVEAKKKQEHENSRSRNKIMNNAPEKKNLSNLFGLLGKKK